jgi:hypothetical protein
VKRAANHNQPAGKSASTGGSAGRTGHAGVTAVKTITQYEQELMKAKYELHSSRNETVAIRKERDEVLKLFAKYVAVNEQHYRETTHRQNVGLFAVHSFAFTYLKENYREYFP